MANPLFQALGGAQMMNGMGGRFGQLVQQFTQFKQMFKGDPQEEVQRLLRSGRISQEQLNIAQSMAQQFGALIK